MNGLRLAYLLRSEQGLVMPVTMMVLVLLVSLTAAFAILSASDPLIVSNLKRGSEAMGLAEAGMEEAMWALSTPTAALWLNFPTMPPPDRYNGAVWVTFGLGGYKITITGGSKEFTVTSEGRIPNDSTATVTRKLTVTLWSLKDRFDPPAPLAVKGQLQVSGQSVVDARTSTCGSKKGAYTLQATTISGRAEVFGGDGNPRANQSTDYSQNQPASSFDALTLTQAELNALKALAKADGKYYKGTVTFDSSNPLPNGLVFVDTASGNPIGNPPDPSDLAAVTVTQGTASGWLIVMGTLNVTARVEYTGLVYVANQLVYSGQGVITGAVITLNVTGSAATTIDAMVGGQTEIFYDCNAIKTGVATGGTGSPTVPQGFFVKPGTWREVTS